MYSVGRVAIEKFGCRVIRRPFVGVLFNEDAVLRFAGSAKTVSSMIIVLDTHAFAKNQVEDTRWHAHTNIFSCHGRTHFQRQCNFTDCHPFFSVNPLITMPHQLLPLSLMLPSQTPRIAFHVVASSRLSMTIFLRPSISLFFFF